jgi:NAD(P)-dependent dehydrogenase (short-subunit alcohol dehydrogenase family)
MPGAVVIGAGPGIGQAAARRFAAEGLLIAVIARRQHTADAVAEHYWHLHTQPQSHWKREIIYSG